MSLPRSGPSCMRLFTSTCEKTGLSLKGLTIYSNKAGGILIISIITKQSSYREAILYNWLRESHKKRFSPKFSTQTRYFLKNLLAPTSLLHNQVVCWISILVSHSLGATSPRRHGLCFFSKRFQKKALPVFAEYQKSIDCPSLFLGTGKGTKGKELQK